MHHRYIFPSSTLLQHRSGHIKRYSSFIAFAKNSKFYSIHFPYVVSFFYFTVSHRHHCQNCYSLYTYFQLSSISPIKLSLFTLQPFRLIKRREMVGDSARTEKYSRPHLNAFMQKNIAYIKINQQSFISFQKKFASCEKGSCVKICFSQVVMPRKKQPSDKRSRLCL